MNHNLLAQVDIGQATKLTDQTSINSYTSFSDIINLVVKNSITIASIILTALLIFGGITFIMSAGSGDSKKADQSKQTLTAALIGFIVVIFSYVIIRTIKSITHLDILNSGL
jgi:hypothetical protein